VNLPQRITLGVGVIAIAVMALFPPWLFTYQTRVLPLRERFAGYYPIWRSNTPSDPTALMQMFSIDDPRFADLSLFSIKLDTTRLGIQIVAALLVTLLLAAILKSRNVQH